MNDNAFHAEPTVAIAYHSGFGHTSTLANAVAAGARRDSLPQIQTPAGTETVEGIAIVPGSRILELDAKTEEGIVWQNLVLTRYAKWSGLSLQPIASIVSSSAVLSSSSRSCE